MDASRVLRPTFACFSDSEAGGKGALDSGHREVPGLKAALSRSGNTVPSWLSFLRSSRNGKDFAGVSFSRALRVFGVPDELDRVERPHAEDRDERRSGALDCPL